jgi:hypothetical protein
MMPTASVARITTAELKDLHRDYKPDRIDKFILVPLLQCRGRL